jgi:hypothetical protein
LCNAFPGGGVSSSSGTGVATSGDHCCWWVLKLTISVRKAQGCPFIHCCIQSYEQKWGQLCQQRKNAIDHKLIAEKCNVSKKKAEKWFFLL